MSSEDDKSFYCIPTAETPPANAAVERREDSLASTDPIWMSLLPVDGGVPTLSSTLLWSSPGTWTSHHPKDSMSWALSSVLRLWHTSYIVPQLLSVLLPGAGDRNLAQLLGKIFH